MECKDSISKAFDGLYGILAAANEVTSVNARSNARVMVFDRRYHLVDLVIRRTRTMIVNADSNIKFGDKLSRLSKALGCGLAVMFFRPARFANSNTVRFMIIGEAIHTVRAHLDVRTVKFLAEFCQLLSPAAHAFDRIRRSAIQVPACDGLPRRY